MCSNAFSVTLTGSVKKPNSQWPFGNETRYAGSLVKYSAMKPCAPTMPRSTYAPPGAMSGSFRSK